MNKIKKVLFTSPISKLQGKELGLLLIISIGAMGFGLFFVVEGFIRCEQPRWFSNVLVCVYNLLILFLNSYFAYKLSAKQAKANLLIAGITIVLIAIQNGIFYYLYSAQIFVSKNSLLIIVPVSCSIAFICVKIWILISSKS
ncbi:MAG TPA: hypothetical protein DEQ30_07680 [Porphyromonadaceae bacterium]|nr:hypothetical protein [Porphyromonadaceae bacterium]